MRMTLRTLLAYLDEAPMDVAERLRIQHELEAQPALRDLVKRIQTLVAQPRMASPAVETAGTLQASQVAEYLDGTLDLAMTRKLEQASLKNDSALSELAALHQILTHWIDQPAQISEGLRERLYDLASPVVAPSAADGAAHESISLADDTIAAIASNPAADGPAHELNPTEPSAARSVGREAMQTAALLLHLREVESSSLTSQPPVSEPLVSQSPMSELPMSQLPMSQSPVSQSPMSEPLVSHSPVSHSPMSELPVSEAQSFESERGPRPLGPLSVPGVEVAQTTGGSGGDSSQRGSWVLAMLVMLGVGFLWWNQANQWWPVSPALEPAVEPAGFDLVATAEAPATLDSAFQLPPLPPARDASSTIAGARTLPPVLPASATIRPEPRSLPSPLGGEPPALPATPGLGLATSTGPTLPALDSRVTLGEQESWQSEGTAPAGEWSSEGWTDIRVPELPPVGGSTGFGPESRHAGLVAPVNSAAALPDDLLPALASDPEESDGLVVTHGMGETQGMDGTRGMDGTDGTEGTEGTETASGVLPAISSGSFVAQPIILALPPVDEESEITALGTTNQLEEQSAGFKLSEPTEPQQIDNGVGPLSPQSSTVASTSPSTPIHSPLTPRPTSGPAMQVPAAADQGPTNTLAADRESSGRPASRHLEWGQQVGTVVLEESSSGLASDDWVVVLPGGRSRLVVRSPQGRSWRFTFSGVSRYQIQESQGQPTVAVQRCFLILETDAVNESLEIVTPKGKLWVTALAADSKLVIEIRPYLPHGSTAATSSPRYYMGCLGIAGRVMVEHQRREEIVFANKWLVVKPDGEAEGFQADVPLAIQNAIIDLQNPQVPVEIQRLSDLVQSQAGLEDLRQKATSQTLGAGQSELDQRSLAALWSYGLGQFDAGFSILNDPAMRDYWDLHIQAIMACLQSDPMAVGQLASAAARSGWATSPELRFVGLHPQTVKRSQVAELIADLEQPQLSRRVLALHTLKMLTNETYDYEPTASGESNRRSLQRWNQWLEDSANARLSVHTGGSLIPSARR